MKLLLDTHILLWTIGKSERIGRALKRALGNPRNELWVSPVSTWEIVLLHEKGRIRLTDEPEIWWGKTIAATPFREAPLTHEIALATRSVGLPHAGPADRLLVATALIHGFTLVTADRNLISTKRIPVLLNR